MSYSENKKVAIVHDWFDKYSGAERVIEQILDLYPDADLFALVDFLPENKRSFIKNKSVKTTFIQRLPLARKKFRHYLPFFPLAVDQIDLRGYDIVLSSSHAVVKGVLTNAEQLHICYCHSPMRYIWDLYHDYLEDAGLKKGVKSFFIKWILHRLRIWDYVSSVRVNHFIANSEFIAKRIKNTYQLNSKVIYPPVNTERYVPVQKRKGYYFTAARMVPYKKLALIAAAFRKMPDRQLILATNDEVTGEFIRSVSPNVTVKVNMSSDDFHLHLSEARAFVYAAEEDFGIVMAEAQAAGVPVIAYRKGGASEIVIDGKTGMLYDLQTEASIIEAVQAFEKLNLDSQIISESAQRFSIPSFKENFKDYVEACSKDFFNLPS
jgi:glycosyltransferase involved in cell wall biosynthesis